MDDSSVEARRLRVASRAVSAVAIIGICAAAVWFAYAVVAETGAQMAAASATATGFGVAWSSAFVAIRSRLTRSESARSGQAG